MSLIYFRKSSITLLSPVRVILDLLVKRFDQMRRIQTSPDRFGKAVKGSSFSICTLYFTLCSVEVLRPLRLLSFIIMEVDGSESA